MTTAATTQTPRARLAELTAQHDRLTAERSAASKTARAEQETLARLTATSAPESEREPHRVAADDAERRAREADDALAYLDGELAGAQEAAREQAEAEAWRSRQKATQRSLAAQRAEAEALFNFLNTFATLHADVEAANDPNTATRLERMFADAGLHGKDRPAVWRAPDVLSHRTPNLYQERPQLRDLVAHLAKYHRELRAGRPRPLYNTGDE
jgi:hypothetical protein